MKPEFDPIVITPQISDQRAVLVRLSQRNKLKLLGKGPQQKKFITHNKIVTVSGFCLPPIMNQKVLLEKNEVLTVEKVFEKKKQSVTIKIKLKKTYQQKLKEGLWKLIPNLKTRWNWSYAKRKIKNFRIKNSLLPSHVLTSISSSLLAYKFKINPPIIFENFNPERLGHAIGNTDTAITELKAGLHGNPKQKIALIFHQNASVEGLGTFDFGREKIAIEFLKRIKLKCVKLYQKKWVLNIFLKALKKAGSTVFVSRRFAHRDILNCKRNYRTIFKVHPNELKTFHEFCKNNQINLEKPLVVFSSREEGNIPFQEKNQVNEKLRYGYRNSSARNLVPAIRWLLKNNFCCVKVGRSKKKFPITQKGFYDYSFDFEAQNPLHDFLFFRECSFYIGDTSGIYVIAEFFRKPVLFYNYAPAVHWNSWAPNYLTLFKKLVYKKTKKPLPLLNQIKQEKFHEIHGEKLPKNVCYVENSSQEILTAVQEMIAFIMLRNDPPKKILDDLAKLRQECLKTDLHLSMNSLISSVSLHS